MTDYQDHARAKNGSERPHGRRRAAEATAIPAGSTRTVRTRVVDTAQPAPGRRTAVLRVARRAAVATVSCAVLIGAAAAGHVGSKPAAPASTVQALMPEAAATSTPAEALATAAAEQSALATDPAAVPAPEVPAEPVPAPAAAEPAPSPAAAEPAPAPAPAEPAPATPAPAVPAPTAPTPAATLEPVAVNDPAGAQAYALSQLGSYGWGASEMPCLTTLWTKESDWSTTATNPSSGAYGIVQSLPAEKMASAGADYRTNYRTQIKWGLNYIKERYQSPCGALNFHLANNWY